MRNLTSISSKGAAMTSYGLKRNAPTPDFKRIDYERMKAEMPKQREALAAAVAAKDALALQAAIRSAVKLWDECGAWPDQWADWQRALDDVLPWHAVPDFDDLAYGRVDIVKVSE